MKALLTPLLLLVVLLFGMTLSIVTPEKDISEYERRSLKSFPEPTIEKIFDSDYYQEIEAYLLDQFVGRQKLREINTLTRYYLFNQLDVNDTFVIDDILFQKNNPLDESSVKHAADLIQSYQQQYFSENDVYYGVLPDKNYFIPEDGYYPRKDYEELKDILEERLQGITNVPLSEQIDLDHFYRTDHHLDQSRLTGLETYLYDSLGVEVNPPNDYDTTCHSPFYGSYYGHAALLLEADTLCYVENGTIESAYVTRPGSEEQYPIYEESSLEGIDAYEVFLGGLDPIRHVHSPEAQTEKELIIFGDSFANSIVPLLLDGYETITMIDLRYASETAFETHVDVEDQDVMFLYSTMILNDAWALD